METTYLVCAVVGGTFLLLQTLVTIFGLGDADLDSHHDVAAEHDPSSAFFKLLSLKTVVAFVTFFGLAGRLAIKRGWPDLAALALALFAGGVALFLVAWLMAGLAQLQSSGNLDLLNALGTTGKVYLRIPAGGAGRGKVTLSVQGRTVEAKAVTRGAELGTGRLVEVIAVPASDTVEVVAVEEI